MTNRPDRTKAIIEDVWCDRASYTPGAAAAITIRVTSHAPRECWLDLRYSHLDQEIGSTRTAVTLAAGTSDHRLSVGLPSESFRGYGIDLLLLDDGSTLAEANTALDVLDDWTQAPRYGFLSDFAAVDLVAPECVRVLARYHVNVVQFYDWMWRHYTLMPPSEEFTDVLGRPLVAQDRPRQGRGLSRARHGRPWLCRGLRRGAGVCAATSG